MRSASGDNRIRLKRRRRSPTSDSITMDDVSFSTSSSDQVDVQLGFNESGQNPRVNPIDDSHSDYYTEEVLEKLLLNNLDVLYNKAISEIIALGYDRETALSAVLTKDLCDGGTDALTNIFYNSMACLKGPVRGNNDELKDKQVFTNLNQLLDVAPNPNGDSYPESSDPVMNNTENMNHGSIGVTPGFGNSGTSDFQENRSVSNVASQETSRREFKLPKWSNLSPTMKLLLKESVALFVKEYKARLKKRQVEKVALEKTNSLKNQEVLNAMLKRINDLNLEGDVDFVPKVPKDKVISSLVNQCKHLEKKVMEKKEWAHHRAVQAARKLSHDRIELRMLKMKREEKEKQRRVEDPTMKKLSEMENELRKVSGQVDIANKIVTILETENAEIRAELEACKLSASESAATSLEASKRDKRYLKRLSAWEKQRAKLQEGIAAEKQKIIEARQEMIQVEEAKKTTEAKWREGQKAKALALAQIQEEKRLKKSRSKWNHKSLRSKLERDLQCHKDNLHSIEQELTRLTGAHHPPNPYEPGPSQTISTRPVLHEPDLPEPELQPECEICSKRKACVMFLPCFHQVFCVNCNEENERIGNGECLTCRVRIQERRRVY